MAVNLITRQIPARVFLQILNTPTFRRILNVIGSEYVSEYDITNNTLRVKLIDKLKLEKYKRGQLKKHNKGSITDLSGGNRFALGRFNSVQILKAVSAINGDTSIKARIGLKPIEQVQTLNMYGSTSVVVRAYNSEELKESEGEKQATTRAQYGVNVQSPRGIR